VAETLEAAVDLAGHFAVGIVDAVEHVSDRLTVLGQEQVLHGDQLGDREAVVHLGHADFAARILDAGLLEGALCGDAGGGDIGAVTVAETALLAV
jgi:hypothetical protein